MLIYSQNFDPFHTTFRLISILEKCEKESMEKERIRIFDIVLSNPTILKDCRLPARSKVLKSYKKLDHNPYEQINSAVHLLSQLEPFHESALRMIAGYGLIEIEKLRSGTIEKRPSEAWSKMKELSNESLSVDAKLISALYEELSDTPIYGKNGIKDRFNLMEYRYDPT